MLPHVLSAATTVKVARPDAAPESVAPARNAAATAAARSSFGRWSMPRGYHRLRVSLSIVHGRAAYFADARRPVAVPCDRRAPDRHPGARHGDGHEERRRRRPALRRL